MSNQIYQKNEFKIYKTINGCIVHNSKYSFIDKHTHMNSVKAAIDLINFVENKKLPRRTSMRYLESMLRISDNEVFNNKIQQFINIKINKKGPKCKKRSYKNIRQGREKRGFVSAI